MFYKNVDLEYTCWQYMIIIKRREGNIVIVSTIFINANTEVLETKQGKKHCRPLKFILYTIIKFSSKVGVGVKKV